MFLSCGDALFDVFAEESADTATVGLSARVGGSPLNVAVGLARLGHPVGFFTKVSGDFFGQRIRAFLESEGVDTGFLVPTVLNTTLATITLGTDGSPAYRFYIEGTADRSIKPDEIPTSLPDRVEALHVASYSTVIEPTATALMGLVERESSTRFVSYDPNVRPTIEPDLELWRERVRQVVPHSSLVKASAEDLALLFPHLSVENVIADWISQGAAMAVVTRGPEGALAVNRSGAEVALEGRAVRVADTVGAGDAFMAALLAGLKERGHLTRQEAESASAGELAILVRRAVDAASYTCTRVGADLPRRADLGLPPL